MYVYDVANNLAKALKESKEYVEYKKAKEEVNNTPEMKQKIDEFEKMRYEVQMMTFQGQNDEEKTKKLQEMYEVLLNQEEIKNYFDIEVRFNVMLADVNRIIGESVKDVIQ